MAPSKPSVSNGVPATENTSLLPSSTQSRNTSHTYHIPNAHFRPPSPSILSVIDTAANPHEIKIYQNQLSSPLYNLDNPSPLPNSSPNASCSSSIHNATSRPTTPPPNDYHPPNELTPFSPSSHPTPQSSSNHKRMSRGLPSLSTNQKPPISPSSSPHRYTSLTYRTNTVHPNDQAELDSQEGGEVPTFMESIKALLLSGWLNVLLIAVPLSFISHFAKWGSTADFIISFIAIIPLASLLGDATEQCSLKLGQTIGGLMNATFGNAVEAIVGIIALVKGELRIVQTSMLGSILSNILLVLGCSFLAAGYKFKESNFQVTAAQASSSLLVLGCTTLIIPAAYHGSRLEAASKYDSIVGTGSSLANATIPDDLSGLLVISRGTALILLFCYGSYLYFQLKSHAYLYEDPSVQEEEEAKMNITTAIGSLVVVTVITSFCADYLVGAIDEFATDFGIPKAFIGLILLPIVGNAAEHVTSVWMAMKGKMEITIGVAVGSSIQIAVGVIPLLVVVGWIIGQELTLFFENLETIILFVSVLLVNLLITDGKSNWLEGLMLVALYFIIALAFWVS